MRWIYILQCDGGYFYVGETSRLYRRFWEHLTGLGGLNTSIFKPEKIVAIYKVDTIGKFVDYNNYVNGIIDGTGYESYKGFKLRDFDDIYDDDRYDKLEAENNIAECFMLHNKQTWNKIRGGKYTRFDVGYNFPKNHYIKQLPLCKCGVPCDIRKNQENNHLFFRCAKKNMWDKMREEFGIDDEPCNFFMEYAKDKQLKVNENKRYEDRKRIIKELFKKSYWLNNVEVNDDAYPRQCIGGCGRTSESIKLSWSNEKRNLCFDCFIDKNDELAKKYNYSGGKCLVHLDGGDI